MSLIERDKDDNVLIKLDPIIVWAIKRYGGLLLAFCALFTGMVSAPWFADHLDREGVVAGMVLMVFIGGVAAGWQWSRPEPKQ